MQELVILDDPFEDGVLESARVPLRLLARDVRPHGEVRLLLRRPLLLQVLQLRPGVALLQLGLWRGGKLRKWELSGN